MEFEFRQTIRLQVWLHSQKKSCAQAEADQLPADWESDIAAGHVEVISTDADAVLHMAVIAGSLFPRKMILRHDGETDAWRVAFFVKA